jgi:L-rhamnose mutarotase
MALVTEFALHTMLKPGMEEAYERIHSDQPAEMTETLRDAGVINWRIWRAGLNLFHLVEVRDIDAMNAHLAASEVNAAWDRTMSEFLSIAPDWQDNEVGIPLVWQIPAPLSICDS